jgi:DNA-binding PadR family transcriptional regulator
MDSNFIEEYLQIWSGRWRGSLLDYYILYHGAYSTIPLYAYAIFLSLSNLWEDQSISIQTIYSRINSLEKSKLINVNREIVGGRLQKIITTSKDGFEVLDQISKVLEKELNSDELKKLEGVLNG